MSVLQVIVFLDGLLFGGLEGVEEGEGVGGGG